MGFRVTVVKGRELRAALRDDADGRKRGHAVVEGRAREVQQEDALGLRRDWEGGVREARRDDAVRRLCGAWGA